MDGSHRCRFDQTAVWHSDAARGPSTPSLDHLVGTTEQRDREGEAECLRGFEVDDHLDLAGLLDWKVARLVALEDAARIGAGEAIGVGRAAAIAHESARGGEL